MGNADDSGEAAALAAVRERSVDGIIFTTVTSRSPSPLTALNRHAPPAVLLNRALEGIAVDSVASDNHAGGQAVAEHFLAHGRKRQALVAGPRKISTSRQHGAGFRMALARAGAALPKSSVLRSDFGHEGGVVPWSTFWCRRARRPTAVSCVNDAMAFGVLGAAREHGIPVPG
jgi:LacI family transcriptional regulator